MRENRESERDERERESERETIWHKLGSERETEVVAVVPRFGLT